MNYSRLAVLALPLLVAACASVPDEPTEPRVMVVPGAKKSPQAFRNDENRCRVVADNAVGGRTPGEASNDSMVRSAALGTALGAGTGALIGSTQGHVGGGALIGAASGLALGSVMGTGAAEKSAATVQRRYDIAYAQCMTDAGNKVAEAPSRTVVVYDERPVYRPAPVVVYEDRRW